MSYFCTSGKIISANKGEGNIQKRARAERNNNNKKRNNNSYYRIHTNSKKTKR